MITAALSAFTIFQSSQFTKVRRLATIGTGSGTDVIAAVEIFPELSYVAMTDLHSDVLEHARNNVLSAVEKANSQVRNVGTGLITRAGDVLSPLKGEQPFDLIYEYVPSFIILGYPGPLKH